MFKNFLCSTYYPEPFYIVSESEMKQLFLILTIFLLLTGCGSSDEPTAEPQPTATPTVQPTVQQPASPLQQSASPLQQPASPLSSSAADTTTAQASAAADIPDTSGVVEGSIMVNLKAGPKPLATTIIALAEVILDEQGKPKVAGYSASSAPRTISDEQGFFKIENVKPGTYGLILDSVISSYLLADPVSGDSILLEVKGGEVTDLGHMEYETLPVAGFAE